MYFKLGDSVRIISSGKTGHICDVSLHNGKDIYIVELDDICEFDILSKKNDKETADLLITVPIGDLEAFTR